MFAKVWKWATSHNFKNMDSERLSQAFTTCVIGMRFAAGPRNLLRSLENDVKKFMSQIDKPAKAFVFSLDNELIVQCKALGFNLQRY